jgi:Na+/melibiose symporter-like transporter
MVILFSKQKKKELYRLIVAVILILGLIFFWVFYFNRKDDDKIVEIVDISEVKEEKINIDFELLENELLKKLISFEFIVATTTQGFGRINPFEPPIVSTTSESTTTEIIDFD